VQIACAIIFCLMNEIHTRRLSAKLSAKALQ